MPYFLSLFLDAGSQPGRSLKKTGACCVHGLTGLGRHEASNRIGEEFVDAVRWACTFFKIRTDMDVHNTCVIKKKLKLQY